MKKTKKKTEDQKHDEYCGHCNGFIDSETGRHRCHLIQDQTIADLRLDIARLEREIFEISKALVCHQSLLCNYGISSGIHRASLRILEPVKTRFDAALSVLQQERGIFLEPSDDK